MSDKVPAPTEGSGLTEAERTEIAVVLAKRHKCLDHNGPNSGPCRTDRDRAALLAPVVARIVAEAVARDSAKREKRIAFLESELAICERVSRRNAVAHMGAERNLRRANERELHRPWYEIDEAHGGELGRTVSLVAAPVEHAPLVGDREAIAQTLAEHGGYVGRVDDGWYCWCGAALIDWWPAGGVTPRDSAPGVALRDHLADALLAPGGPVRAVASLADDQALVRRVALIDYDQNAGAGDSDDDWVTLTEQVLRALAAALQTPRGKS